MVSGLPVELGVGEGRGDDPPLENSGRRGLKDARKYLLGGLGMGGRSDQQDQDEEGQGSYFVFGADASAART